MDGSFSRAYQGEVGLHPEMIRGACYVAEAILICKGRPGIGW